MEEKNTAECSICLKKMKREFSSLENCAHIFHSPCIKKWSEENNSCPLCRKPIRKESEKSYKNIFYPIIFYSNHSGGGDLYMEEREENTEIGRNNYSDDESSNSDDERSIDYGDESDFEKEMYHPYRGSEIFSFRLADEYVVSRM